GAIGIGVSHSLPRLWSEQLMLERVLEDGEIVEVDVLDVRLDAQKRSRQLLTQARRYRPAFDQPLDRASQCSRRHRPVDLSERNVINGACVLAVACQQLVATFTGQHNLYVLGGETR